MKKLALCALLAISAPITAHAGGEVYCETDFHGGGKCGIKWTF